MLDDLYIGLGANLAHPRFGPPKTTLEHVLTLFPASGLRVLARSPWYESAPVPVSDQPWYINGVVRVATALSPQEVLASLHAIEAELGRQRVERNEARAVDLDIIAFGKMILNGLNAPIVPHPRMTGRAFVLLPLADLAPDWRHPADGRTLPEMIRALPPEQSIRPLPTRD